MSLSVMFGGWRARMHSAHACTLPRGVLGRRLFSHARPSVRKLLRARPLVVHARNPGDFGGVPDELPSFGDEEEDSMDDMGGEQDVPDESLDLDEGAQLSNFAELPQPLPLQLLPQPPPLLLFCTVLAASQSLLKPACVLPPISLHAGQRYAPAGAGPAQQPNNLP